MAEVVIEANDGTKGELAFSTASIQVDEELQSSVMLTLNRMLGVFGRVSVYVYASTKARGAVNGEDFNFTDRVSLSVLKNEYNLCIEHLLILSIENGDSFRHP